MSTTISISRLRKIVADSDAAYAAARDAGKAANDARAALRRASEKHGEHTDAGTIRLLEWDRIAVKDWPADYSAAKSEFEAALAKQAHAHDVTAVAGTLKRRALDFAKAQGIPLPADLQASANS